MCCDRCITRTLSTCTRLTSLTTRLSSCASLVRPATMLLPTPPPHTCTHNSPSARNAHSALRRAAFHCTTWGSVRGRAHARPRTSACTANAAATHLLALSCAATGGELMHRIAEDNEVMPLPAEMLPGTAGRIRRVGPIHTFLHGHVIVHLAGGATSVAVVALVP